MNDCEFVGNLVKDPTLRQTQSGKAVVSFTIATNEDYVTPQGEKKQLTESVSSILCKFFLIPLKEIRSHYKLKILGTNAIFELEQELV